MTHLSSVVFSSAIKVHAPVNPYKEKDIRWKMAHSVAMASLKELAVALSFAAVTCLFVATAAEVSLLIVAAITVVAINTLIRGLGAAGKYYMERIPGKGAFSYKFCKVSLTVCNYLSPYSFSFLDYTTRNVVIHEAGHAVAATALFKNANPQIRITPFSGGVVHYWTNGLTRIGKYFGEVNARLIVAAAGPAFAVLASTIQVGVAHIIKKKHPTLSRYLLVTAIVSVIGHVRYALSALSIKHHMEGHDFVVLMMGGIHPMTAIIGMVALPLIVKLGLTVYDRLKARQPVAAAAA